MEVEIAYRRQKYYYRPDQFPCTVLQVKRYLETEIHIAIDDQKLIWKGSTLSNTEILQLPIKLILIGTTAVAQEELQVVEHHMQKEKQIKTQRNEISIAALNASYHEMPEFRFHRIEPLTQFSDQHRARELLERLANDRGILAVMQKYRWQVGTLAEMYPDGKVGVDPVCVLGLNVNKGQKILLRLRTDDLQGFRKYLAIKECLYHELTHNVHSEHDNQFYQLMRQVAKEAIELDWTTSKGQASGGINAIPKEETKPSFIPTLQKLGGSVDKTFAPQELSARAAEARKLPPAPIPKTKSLENSPVSSSVAPKPPKVEAPSPEPAPDAVTPPPEELVQACNVICSEGEPERIITTIKALGKITHNLLKYRNEPKYQQIRIENPRFQQTIGTHPGGISFLVSLGFEFNSEHSHLFLTQFDLNRLHSAQYLLFQVEQIYVAQ